MLLLYPATRAENILGLEGVLLEISRQQITLQPDGWMLNVDGWYAYNINLSQLSSFYDADVIILPTSRCAAHLIGGTIHEHGITLLSGNLPESTVDVMVRIKQPWGKEDASGVVAILNARGVIGAVYT